MVTDVLRDPANPKGERDRETPKAPEPHIRRRHRPGAFAMQGSEAKQISRKASAEVLSICAPSDWSDWVHEAIQAVDTE